MPVTMSLSPYFEDNNITDRCIVIPGELDIGKWFRNTGAIQARSQDKSESAKSLIAQRRQPNLGSKFS